MSNSTLTLLPAAVLTVSLCQVALTDDNAANLTKILNTAIEIAETDDTFKAFAYLQSQGEPIVVAGHYSSVFRKVHREEKDVPLMVMFGRAGISYSLEQARVAEKTDEDAANKLKGYAKSIAYNLGANTWPGWNDKGIFIDNSSKKAGLDAARLNLRLAIDLKRNDEVLGNAHWWSALSL